jgi:TolB-like protein/DNA-binding winged helix-turn-helix (wHTH) protein/Flp pilus assembly protein TadD/rhodanese-related sulfurtransferase
MQTLAAPDTIAFGPFVLDLGSRALLARGEKLALSSRAFDILVFLVTARDRVVGKDEIMTTVWRGVAVEENNLAVQISALRRVLGEHAEGQTMIATVPGQGYRFVGRVELPEVPPPPPAIALPVETPALSHAAPAADTHRPWLLMAASGALVLAVVLLGILYMSRPAPPPRLSLAVLPFRNLGEDSKQDYLADAITDDLTTDLSHLPGSVVIARESSDVYKGRAVPAEQIGRALHVRYLLEGSLRAVDGMFHINAQLIDAGNGAHLWADGFDVPRDKLLDAQTAIVGHIANALNVALVAIESSRSLHERPSNPDALDFYLRARSIHNTAQTLDQLTQAQRLFEQAIALQPDYVDALAELSLLLLEKSREHDNPDDSTDHAEANADIARALGLDPSNVTALTAKGLAQSMDFQFEESEASLKAALATDPNNVTARAYLAYDDWRLGRPQASVDGYTEVLRLDPQGPVAKKRFSSLGMAYFMVGNFDRAIAYLLRGLAGNPSTTSAGVDRIEFSNMFLIAAYDQLGKKDQARKLYAQYRQQWPHRSVWRLSAYFSKAETNVPSFKALTTGLADAGMPQFEHLPDVPGDAVNSGARGDFDPAPMAVAGARSIDVAMVSKLLAADRKPVIIDVGIGAAAIAGSILVPHPDDKTDGLGDQLSRIPKGSTLIVVGNGFYGWSGYEAATVAVAAGIGPVFWLIGGEEALAAAGYPVQDDRVP